MSGSDGMFDGNGQQGEKSGPEGGGKTSWSAYSDYQKVTRQAAQEVHLATRAYAWLTAQHREGARLRAEKTANESAYIQSAAMRMLPELRANQETNDIIEGIYTRWTEDGEYGLEGGKGDPWPPYLNAFEEAQLHRGVPPWLGQFVEDIQQAAWEIGYLKAGKSQRERDVRSPEEMANAMFNS